MLAIVGSFQLAHDSCEHYIHAERI
jgi:hypothetical protein